MFVATCGLPIWLAASAAWLNNKDSVPPNAKSSRVRINLSCRIAETPVFDFGSHFWGPSCGSSLATRAPIVLSKPPRFPKLLMFMAREDACHLAEGTQGVKMTVRYPACPYCPLFDNFCDYGYNKCF